MSSVFRSRVQNAAIRPNCALVAVSFSINRALMFGRIQRHQSTPVVRRVLQMRNQSRPRNRLAEYFGCGAKTLRDFRAQFFLRSFIEPGPQRARRQSANKEFENFGRQKSGSEKNGRGKNYLKEKLFENLADFAGKSGHDFAAGQDAVRF